MSARFKVGDLVVRNPEVRGVAGWPYHDEVCRVVGYYPNQNWIIVAPVNSPHNKRLHDCGWAAERFAPAAIFDPCPARRNDPPNSKVAALAMIDFVEGPITALRAALAEQPAEQEPVAWWHRKSDTFTSGNLVSNFAEWTPLYTAPQPRRRLTDEEIDAITHAQWGTWLPGVMVAAHRECARAFEAAVWGEKT